MGEATTSCCCSSVHGIAKVSIEVAPESRCSDFRCLATLDAPLDSTASMPFGLLSVPLPAPAFNHPGQDFTWHYSTSSVDTIISPTGHSVCVL